jgi:hypothetical protein
MRILSDRRLRLKEMRMAKRPKGNVLYSLASLSIGFLLVSSVVILK